MEIKADNPHQFSAIGKIVEKYPTKSRVVATIQATDALLRDLVTTTFWPTAVLDSMIVRHEPSKKIRAGSIVTSFVKQPVSGKKVLDFGCGDGYCVLEAGRLGADAIGYDISSKDWTDDRLTTDWDKVVANGPYDIVILYDVIDHAIGDPLKILKAIASVTTSSTRIYMRCHPYTSPHATHVYPRFNKAFVHLLFSEKELLELGAGDPEPAVMIKDYTKLIIDSGMVVVGQPTKVTVPPLPFFNDDFILQKINDTVSKGSKLNRDTLWQTLSVHFIDYVLAASAVESASLIPWV